MSMACQCSTTAATTETEGFGAPAGCGCDTASGCDCGTDAPQALSDRELKLERIVMDLDKRLRRVESTVKTTR